jgi:hypothetical protein
MTGDGRVTVSYLHPGHVDTHFHLSLLRMLQHDWNREGGPILRGHIPVEANSGGICDSRNQAVREYLEHYDDEWFWFVDADMGFAPDTVDALLASADADERPIMGALCFGQAVNGSGADMLGVPQYGYRYFPTIFVWNETTGREETAKTYPIDSIVQCQATGAACILIHRRVFETMREKYVGPHHWFRQPIVESQTDDPVRYMMGEDVAFCRMAADCGFPIYVDTAIKTSHRKLHYLTEESAHLYTAAHQMLNEPEPNRQQRRKKKSRR